MADKKADEVIIPSKDETAEERDSAVLPKDENEEVSPADAPVQENKPTKVDPEYDRADPEDKLEAEEGEDDDYVVDPIGGGKLAKDSPFNPYRGL